MFASLMKLKFFRERRASILVAFALMAVPLFISAEAAVDLSRAVTARTLLQAAVDTAATAGASAWHISESPAYASSVASATFSGSASNLGVFGSYNNPTPELACNGVTSVCNVSNASTSYVTTPSTYNCPNASAAQYCVVVTATVTTRNWLFNHLAPNSLVTVTGYGQEALTTPINGSNVPPSPGFGSAGDVSGIYAYAVPMSSTAANAVPEFGQVPQPNSACSGYSSTGPLALEGLSSGSATNCNYLFVALSTSSGTANAGGSLTLQQNQPIAFSFTNYTGANGYNSGNYVSTATNLDVSVDGGTSTYNAGGYSVPAYSVTTYTTNTNTYTCEHNGSPTTNTTYYNNTGTQPLSCKPANIVNTGNNTNTSSSGTNGTVTNCTSQFTKSPNTYCKVYTTAVTTSNTQNFPATPLSGSCPDHTLYGSLDPLSVNGTTGANNDGIPVADSLNVYSSAFEVMGEPPTYETNHALIPFVSPITTNTMVNGHSYAVNAICPNYDTTSTQISAPISGAYATTTGWTGLNIFSTAFPGQSYNDSAVNPPEDTSGLYTTNKTISMTSLSNDYYPPGIAACTPAYSGYDGGVTPTADDPWWNWNGSNSGKCANESTTYQGSSALTRASAFHADITLPDAAQSYQPIYNDCALIIQDLGTAGTVNGNKPTVPLDANNHALLPDYYLVLKNSSGTVIALDPVYNHANWYDKLAGVITSQLTSIDSKITVNATTHYVTDTDTAATYNTSGSINTYGFTPTSTNSYVIASGTYAGDTVVVEQPATSGAPSPEFDPPPDTSHQCYDPENNGNTSAVNGVTIQAGQGATVAYTANGGANPVSANPVDPIANPQLGAILCDSANPETYALYWNDLGTYETDDVGYWNAITAFTCSVPGSSRAGGLATLG